MENWQVDGKIADLESDNRVRTSAYSASSLSTEEVPDDLLTLTGSYTFSDTRKYQHNLKLTCSVYHDPRIAQTRITCIRHTLSAWRRSLFAAAVLCRRGVAHIKNVEVRGSVS